MNLGSFKVEHIFGDAKTFYINKRNIESISISSSRKSANINNAYLTFADGTTEDLWNLTGKVSNGKTVTAYVDNQYKVVRSITVEASSRNIKGSRPQLSVSAVVGDSVIDRPRRRR